MSYAEKAVEIADSLDYSFLQIGEYKKLKVDEEIIKEDAKTFFLREIAIPYRFLIEGDKIRDCQRMLEERYEVFLMRRIEMFDSFNKNPYDVSGECRDRWLHAFFSFENIMRTKGYEIEIVPSIKYFEGKYNVLARKSWRRLKIKLKSSDKVDRKDLGVDDDWLWIEITDVNGSVGWLYGTADFIAFETNDGFLMVDRKKLTDKVREVADFYLVLDNKFEVVKQYVVKNKIPLYKREKRNDEILLVPSKLITPIGVLLEKF